MANNKSNYRMKVFFLLNTVYCDGWCHKCGSKEGCDDIRLFDKEFNEMKKPAAVKKEKS